MQSANILIVDAVPSPSHQIWMRALSFALGKNGHNVTVLSCSKPKEAPINVHYLAMPEVMEWMSQDMDVDFLDMANMNSFVKMIAFLPMYKPLDEVALNSTGFKTLINYPRDFKVDLMIFDYLSTYGLMSLKEFFNNPPLIAVSPYPGIGVTNLMTRGPDFTSFIPHMMKDELENSFIDRLENFVISSVFNLLEQYYILPTATKTVKKVLPGQKQSIKDMFESSIIQMANYHPVIDAVQPLLPNVIPVGGLQIVEPKPLPQKLENIYSRKSKGNVIFSLGSNVKSEDLGESRLKQIIGALREIPDYNFIWKIDIKGLRLHIPNNVFIQSWLPQNDLLADNRTTLFISHAGGLSTQESIWFGVPMLALPVMFDQFPVG